MGAILGPSDVMGFQADPNKYFSDFSSQKNGENNKTKKLHKDRYLFLVK